MRAVRHGFRPVAPHVDAYKQEQPHHVDEMPVPGGELETEMLGRAKMPGIGADQAHNQEYRSNEHVEAVEPGRHEKCRAVDIAGKGKRGMGVLVGLHAGEARAQQDRQDQAIFQSNNAWCAQVTVVPEVNSNNVFSSGRCQGSKVSMPFGGQTPPNSASRVA